ncbi:hypothetical protein CO046_05655, partial [Candidatus Peregrinibacteria bacterium CG_4_9_14_0_2_um_filter_53_11]
MKKLPSTLRPRTGPAGLATRARPPLSPRLSRLVQGTALAAGLTGCLTQFPAPIDEAEAGRQDAGKPDTSLPDAERDAAPWHDATPDGGLNDRGPNDGGLQDAVPDDALSPRDSGSDGATVDAFTDGDAAPPRLDAGPDGEPVDEGSPEAAVDADLPRDAGLVDAFSDDASLPPDAAPPLCTDEICNGIDDDCDDIIDEASDRSCHTICGNGVERCVGGRLEACNAPLPQNETCNRQDDDCDGLVDEAHVCDLGEPCHDGVGACRVDGVITADGCDAVADAPGVESCNGLDDDCDGRVDNGTDRACETACGPGFERCVGGVLQDCDAPRPSSDVCDGRDNDCDGILDNGCGIGQECSVGEGVCAQDGRIALDPTNPGETFCETGGAAPQPGAETCNNLDDDCDGRTDEAFPQSGENCTVGVGACERTGNRICESGVLACNVQAGQPSGEVCNGLDDDCDGVVDNNEAAAEDERCDGADNDCDGQVDESDPRIGTQCTLPCEVGACAVGRINACIDSQLVCEQVTFPQQEVCGNGLDEDCSGLADDAPHCFTGCNAGSQIPLDPGPRYGNGTPVCL